MADFAIGSWDKNDPEGLRDKNARKIETTIDNLGNETPIRPKVSKLDVFSKNRNILRFQTDWKPKNPKAIKTRKLTTETIIVTANKLGKIIGYKMTPFF